MPPSLSESRRRSTEDPEYVEEIPSMPGSWAEYGRLITNFDRMPMRKESRTMEFDRSQPPTPDGTGCPANFHVIAPGIFRCSYPTMTHFESLSQLELKTIITLVPEPLAPEYINFSTKNGIVHHQIPILANKDPEIFTEAETIHKVLRIILDPTNYPLLVHCNKGKHRTGCITACFRKVTGWTLEACLEEYVRYSTPKDRPLDKVFIENFDATVLKPLALERGFIGGAYRQPLGVSQTSNYSSVYTNNTLETYTSEDSAYAEYSHERMRRDTNELSESPSIVMYR